MVNGAVKRLLGTRTSSTTRVARTSCITQDDHDKYLRQFKSRQQEINLLLEEHTNADESYHIAASTVLNLAKRALAIFESSEVPEKRALLNYLLQTSVVQGKKPVFTLRSPFD